MPQDPELDERIRRLCTLALTTPESELNPVLEELREALHEHADRVREISKATLKGLGKQLDRRPQKWERRSG